MTSDDRIIEDQFDPVMRAVRVPDIHFPKKNSGRVRSTGLDPNKDEGIGQAV